MFSSYDIARSADIVFSEVLSINQFNKLDSKNLKILNKTDDYIFYKNTKFELKENDVIFTHTGTIKNLFYLLRNVDKKLNLTLITHQADLMIDKKLLMKKPECICNWFGVNVDSFGDDLIPIPIGLANEYSPKNVQKHQILNDIDINSYIGKEQLLYINFTDNTNFNERGWIKDYFQNKKWASIEKGDLTIDQYINKIKKFSFAICPWGNGVDTHRIWEALSLGTVPIVKKHVTFSNLSGLPILFVDDFKQVNEELLNNFLTKLGKGVDFNLDKLYSDYWIGFTKRDLVEGIQTKEIIESNLVFNYFNYLSTFKSKLNIYLKIINYYIRKIKGN